MKTRQAFTLIELLVVIAIISILAAIIFPVFSSARAKARQITCASNLHQIGLGLTEYLQDSDEIMPCSYFGTTNALAVTAPSDPVTYYKWMDAIYPYVKSEAIFTCPEDVQSPPYHYRDGLNYGSYGQNGAYRTSIINGDRWLYPPRSSPQSTSVPPDYYTVSVAQLNEPSSTVWATDTNNGFAVAAGGKANGNYGFVWADPTVNPTIKSFNGIRQLNQIAERHQGFVEVLYCDSHVKAVKLDNLAKTKPEVGPDGNFYNVMTAFTVEGDG